MKRAIVRELLSCYSRQIRHIERWHEKLFLAIHMQHRTTRHHYLEARNPAQERVYNFACLNQMLKVVKQQQQLLLLEMRDQALQRWHIGGRIDIYCLHDALRNQRGIAHRIQRHKPYSLCKVLDQFCGNLLRQPCLAAPAWSYQRHQAGLFAQQGMAQIGYSLLASNQPRERCGQVVL